MGTGYEGRDRWFGAREEESCTHHIPSLHDEHSMALGDELLEDLGEVLGHLLERQLDGFVLALVQMVHQVADGL